MNLAIDLGNTAFKAAIFDEKKLFQKQIFAKNDHQALKLWLEKYVREPVPAIVSSVVNAELNFSELPVSGVHILDHQDKLPLRLDYETPETLGRDRLANACGAWSLNPGRNSLVIDLGTCIKYDLVHKSGTYMGGAISPGLGMRFRSLHEFTDKLPLLVKNTAHSIIGTSTATSMAVGVKDGIVHEINGFIDRYSHEYEGLTIFMTGGDASHFDKGFKNAIFANPDLTLIGLNEILLLNQS